MDDPFVLAGETFTSRLLLGTGGASSLDSLERAIRASGAEIVTVALRRLPSAMGAAGNGRDGSSLLSVLDRTGVRILPNTAGCRTAAEAVSTAHMAREAFGTDWVKL